MAVFFMLIKTVGGRAIGVVSSPPLHKREALSESEPTLKCVCGMENGAAGFVVAGNRTRGHYAGEPQRLKSEPGS